MWDGRVDREAGREPYDQLTRLPDALGTEPLDWRRFERAGQLACYLGLISREDSGGNRQRLG